jgi:hypothetical protein
MRMREPERRSLTAWLCASIVGQVVNLRPIVNRPAVLVADRPRAVKKSGTLRRTVHKSFKLRARAGVSPDFFTASKTKRPACAKLSDIEMVCLPQ